MAFFLQVPPPDGGPGWDSTLGTVILVVLVVLLSPVAAIAVYAILKQYGYTQRPLLYGSIFGLGILVALLVRLIMI